MKSKKEDDTSAPLLEAMRKAASQFSGKRPSFIAVREHDIEAADLMLPHVRRRIGILSYALFGHNGAGHVNATVVTGFGAVVVRRGVVLAASFSIPNPSPTHPASVHDADIFLRTVTDQEFADAIGAPLSAPNISKLPIDM